MSNDTISIHLKVAVPTATAEGFEALMVKVVDRSQGEPGTLVYEWYQAVDGTWHILERYADAERGDTHVRGFAENYAGRFFELAESCEATVADNAPLTPGALWRGFRRSVSRRKAASTGSEAVFRRAAQAHAA